MGSKGSKNVTTSNTISEPWEEAHPLLKTGLARAQELYSSGDLTPAPFGSRLGAESGYTSTARDMAANTAMNNPMTPAVMGSYMNAINPDVYGDLGRVEEEAIRTALPAAASYFENSGMLNSTVAQEELARQAAGAIAPIKYGAWDAAQNRALSGLSMAPQMMGIPYMDAQMLGEVGRAQDIRNQQERDDAATLYYETEDQDYTDLQRIAQLGMGFGGAGGTSSGTSTAGTNPGWMGTLGNVLSIGGTIAGMFSDRDMKKDIKKVGELPDGTNAYEYRYKDDPKGKKYVGVMADEVPWASFKTPLGMAVDYSEVF